MAADWFIPCRLTSSVLIAAHGYRIKCRGRTNSDVLLNSPTSTLSNKHIKRQHIDLTGIDSVEKFPKKISHNSSIVMWFCIILSLQHFIPITPCYDNENKIPLCFRVLLLRYSRNWIEMSMGGHDSKIECEIGVVDQLWYWTRPSNLSNRSCLHQPQET